MRNRLISTILLGIGFVLVTREKDQKERARKNEQEQRLNAVAEHRRARSALDRATDGIVGDFLTSQLQRLDERQKGFLRELLHDYESFARQPEDDEETRQQVASALLRAGKIQFLIGELDASEAALRQAIGRYVELAEQHPEKLQYLQAAADGHLDLFRVFRARNDLTNAQVEVAQAGDRYARLVQIKDDPKYRMQLALCRAEAGVIASDAGQEEVAERLFRQVREEHEKLRAAEMDSIVYIREEGRNLQNLALVEEKQGRLSEALATLTEAERWFQMLHQKVAR